MNTIARIFNWLLGLSVALIVFNLVVLAADIQCVSPDLRVTLWKFAGIGFFTGAIGSIVMVAYEEK